MASSTPIAAPRNPATRRVWVALFLAVAAVGTVAGVWIWQNAFRRQPLPEFASDEMQFKYGALGYGTLGQSQGFPLYIFRVLPEVFADKLPRPGGWDAFGLVTEPGMDQPVGFARTDVGFPGLVPNCALCHCGTVRAPAGTAPRLIVGAPAHQLDFDAFNEFVFACADDPRFTTSELLPRIEKIAALTASERLFYRLLIPMTARQIRAQAAAFAWQKRRPVAGCGRSDGLNRFKINVLKLDDDGTVGTSDYPPLWNQTARDGQWLHWNASGKNRLDEYRMSVLPTIKDAGEFSAPHFDRLARFLGGIASPRYPFEIDAAKADQGKAIYQTHCAECHAPGGGKTGLWTPQKEVGTDAAFLAMWTPAFVDKLKAIHSPPFAFPAIQRTDGYANVPLDGCWMRAPYLHNGSVPNLAALLSPPDARPRVFHGGSDVYDTVRVGFRSDESLAGENLFRFDTSRTGNGNGGHVYGTELPAEQKLSLIEYLKTL